MLCDTEKFRHDVVTEIEKQKRSNLDIHENQYVLGYVRFHRYMVYAGGDVNFFQAFYQEQSLPFFLFVTKESPDLIRNTAQKLGVDSIKSY